MNRTISYLRADMDRAKNQGARTLEISLLDLREILSLAESAEMHAQTKNATKNATKHAGWIKPGSLSMLRSGGKNFTRISRRRSDEFNTEIFFAADLREKQREIDAAKDRGFIVLECSKSAIDVAEQEDAV